ncbi:MAG TPA: hypothetical protein DCL44_11430 [Elusimicrobia bacterium]|nr:hypothetical protein [Elusimicrobiota bacterium]
MNDNIFEDYYKDACSPERNMEPPRGEDSVITEDAKLIKDSINDFVGKMNKLVGTVFDKEKAKGTRDDLVVTVVAGGLAFAMANVYYLLTRDIGARMSKEEFQRTFFRMCESAFKNMEKRKDSHNT